MKIDEGKIHEQISRAEKDYKTERDAIEQNAVVDSAISGSYSLMGMSARDMGICEVLLNNIGAAQDRFSNATDHFVTSLVKTYEYEEKTNQLFNRVIHCRRALFMAILAREPDQREEYIKKSKFISDSFVDQYPSKKHEYLHVQALAHYLTGDTADAKEYLARLADAGEKLDGYFIGMGECLRGLIDDDVTTFEQGLNRLLTRHHNEHGANPSSPTHFISVEATAYLILADRQNMKLPLSDLDDSLRGYVPEMLFA